jgi:hypothetical protein
VIEVSSFYGTQQSRYVLEIASNVCEYNSVITETGSLNSIAGFFRNLTVLSPGAQPVQDSVYVHTVGAVVF